MAAPASHFCNTKSHWQKINTWPSNGHNTTKSNNTIPTPATGDSPGCYWRWCWLALELGLVGQHRAQTCTQQTHWRRLAHSLGRGTGLKSHQYDGLIRAALLVCVSQTLCEICHMCPTSSRQERQRGREREGHCEPALRLKSLWPSAQTQLSSRLPTIKSQKLISTIARRRRRRRRA